MTIKSQTLTLSTYRVNNMEFDDEGVYLAFAMVVMMSGGVVGLDLRRPREEIWVGRPCGRSQRAGRWAS